MMRMFPHADWYDKVPERFRHKDKLADFAKMLIKMEAICGAIEKGTLDPDEIIVKYNLVRSSS